MTHVRPARAGKRNGRGAGSQRPQCVSATELARWFDCARSYLNEIEAQGVIERDPQRGFALQPSVLRYIRFLRRERRQSSPQNEAQVEYQHARARWLELKLLEREGVLMPVSECQAIQDSAIGIVLRALHSLPSRLFFRDQQARKHCEQAIRDIRREISAQCSQHAAELRAQANGQDHATAVARNDTQ